MLGLTVSVECVMNVHTLRTVITNVAIVMYA